MEYVQFGSVVPNSSLPEAGLDMRLVVEYLNPHTHTHKNNELNLLITHKQKIVMPVTTATLTHKQKSHARVTTATLSKSPALALLIIGHFAASANIPKCVTVQTTKGVVQVRTTSLFDYRC